MKFKYSRTFGVDSGYPHFPFECCKRDENGNDTDIRDKYENWILYEVRMSISIYKCSFSQKLRNGSMELFLFSIFLIFLFHSVNINSSSPHIQTFYRTYKYNALVMNEQNEVETFIQKKKKNHKLLMPNWTELNGLRTFFIPIIFLLTHSHKIYFIDSTDDIDIDNLILSCNHLSLLIHAIKISS